MNRPPSRTVFLAGLLLAVAGAGAALQPGGQPTGQPQPGQPATGQPGQPGGPGRGQGGPGARGGQGQQVSFDGAMKGMNRSVQRLNDQIADASKKDENLGLINDVQRNCVVAKGLPLPAKVTEKLPDDAARTKAAASVRAYLIQALRLTIDMEQDVIDGKTKEAKTKLEALNKLRDDTHHEFGVKDED